MAREFRLPDIGEGLTEAEIVRWLVAEGEHVAADQPVVEVETDKAVVEIPSPYAGVVIAHGAAEGEVIEVGQVLVTIGEPDEESSPAAETAPPATDDEAPTSSHPEPIVGTLSDEAEVLSAPTDGAGAPPATVQALPIVRKLARENGVDLETVTGSGPGGRITRADVEAVIGNVKQEPEPLTTPHTPTQPHVHHAVSDVAVGAGHGISDDDFVPPAPAAPTGEDERRQMSRLRRTISANMSKSWAEIPRVTTFEDVDATRLLEVRKALGDRHEVKIPLEALVIKALLPAIDEFPEFNSSIDGDDLILHSGRHIGIAVDTAEGLMVAVIRDAEQKTVLELAAEVRRLGEGARDRSLTADELAGQTFTVSNIGAVGGGHGTPIVPYGTVAILSVGKARLRPVVFDEDLGIAPVMPLSLSYDHRVIDGAMGRRFTALLIENLEEPALFLAG
ncbi:MAG TPA: dihydrolipoamide acetyltransferase family protein [Acidimicrobiia bacterium]|nr:dihydrolipoamide acetyltransferase family protein [Acidimicrobiia bacterium]